MPSSPASSSGNRESRLVQLVRREYERLPSRPERILIGYSGGADSLALLVLLSSLSRTLDTGLLAVHVDHGIRAESRDDAKVAAANCQSLGIDVVVRRIDPSLLANHGGVGREEALRRERYRAFSSVVDQSGADTIALAHHQRDQAETVLLHLLRGSGIHGAAGMRPVSVMSVPWWTDSEPVRSFRVWRPLLRVFPDDLREVAAATGLPIADDGSNQDESYRRNAIRHSILPVLEQVVPGATSNLARFASLAAVDADELDAQAAAALVAMSMGDSLSRDALVALPEAIRSRAVRQWIARNGPTGIEISSERVEALLDVMASPGGTRTVEVGRGMSVEVSRDRLRIVRQPFT